MFNDLWATFSQQFPDNFASLLTVSTVETVYMSVLSTLIAALLGLPLGFLTFLTNKGAILENKKLNAFLNVIINIGRSIPYIILLLALIPLTSWLLPGGSIGSNAAIVSLSAAATPFFARLTSNALFEIPTGLTETAKAMGATNWQIIRKFYLPESLPTLINAITLTFVTLIGYTAMAGTQYAISNLGGNDCYRDYRDAQSKIRRYARKTSGSPLIIFYTILFTTRKKHEIKKLICYHRYCISISINRL